MTDDNMSQPCRCGSPGTPRDLLFHGDYFTTFYACEKCMAESESELAEWRRQFNSLLDAGMSTTEANAEIIKRMDDRKALTVRIPNALGLGRPNRKERS